MQLGFLTIIIYFAVLLTIFACSFIMSPISKAVLHTIDIRTMKHVQCAAIFAHGIYRIAVSPVKNTKKAL